MGALVGGEALEIEVGELASDIVGGPADPDRPAIHPCPICAYPMTPYTVAGPPDQPPVAPIHLDRCVDDKVVWFDSGEIKRVRDAIAPSERARAPLFHDAVGLLKELRDQSHAIAAGELVEIPLAEPLVIKPGEWEKRTLCSDPRCIGVVGEQGVCSICRRKAS